MSSMVSSIPILEHKQAPVLLIGATVAIIIGAEIFHWSVKELLSILGWHVSWFGMIVVAAAVSSRRCLVLLTPARSGHAEISVGNILGTVLFFVLCNAGVIALIHPLTVDSSVLRFYWPAMMLALFLVTVFLWRGRIARTEAGIAGSSEHPQATRVCRRRRDH